MSLHDVVPWVVGAGNVASAAMTGHGIRAGWPVLVAAQVTLIAYGILTGQYGFVLQVVLVVVASINWWKWRRREHDRGVDRK